MHFVDLKWLYFCYLLILIAAMTLLYMTFNVGTVFFCSFFQSQKIRAMAFVMNNNNEPTKKNGLDDIERQRFPIYGNERFNDGIAKGQH